MMIDGEPWFVGKDVAQSLGYVNHKDALKKHVDDEDKMGSRIATPSRGKQQVTIINESGLYSLILSSKLDSARQFKRWVTSEVLPSIRKTGSYVKDNDRWLETRQSTKDTHKPFTSAIRLLIGHLDARDVKFRAGGWLNNSPSLALFFFGKETLTIEAYFFFAFARINQSFLC